MISFASFMHALIWKIYSLWKNKAQYFPADICMMDLMRRHAYPCRFADMVLIFGIPSNRLCDIYHSMIDYIHDRYTRKLNQFEIWVSKFPEFARFFGALGHLILIRSWISTATSKERKLPSRRIGECWMQTWPKWNVYWGEIPALLQVLRRSVLKWVDLSRWTFQRKDARWWNVEPEWLDTHFGARGSSGTALHHFRRCRVRH